MFLIVFCVAEKEGCTAAASAAEAADRVVVHVLASGLFLLPQIFLYSDSISTGTKSL